VILGAGSATWNTTLTVCAGCPEWQTRDNSTRQAGLFFSFNPEVLAWLAMSTLATEWKPGGSAENRSARLHNASPERENFRRSDRLIMVVVAARCFHTSDIGCLLLPLPVNGPHGKQPAIRSRAFPAPFVGYKRIIKATAKSSNIQGAN